MSGLASERTIYSFIVDTGPRFAYQGWHLAQSLINCCEASPADIHVHCTPEVEARVRGIFGDLGCQVHTIERFGDGAYSNKLNQLPNLLNDEFGRVVLLDTDTIVVSDLRPFLSDSAILGKAVDLDRPPLATLEEIAWASGLSNLPARCGVDTGTAQTYVGNCNGGFYCAPRAFCEVLSREWRHWGLWLFDHIEPLSRIGRQNHADQVSFWLALQHGGLPFQLAPSNVNYFVHFAGRHMYLDETRPIAMLHYHARLNALGQLDPGIELNSAEQAAVDKANQQIKLHFDDRISQD